MESVKYQYIGEPCSVWDENGGIHLNRDTSQKELEYLYSKNYDNIVKLEEDKPKK